ncbi:MAG: SAM-dependent methyltransferase [Betaproteobacteria bacterium]|nr:SAM-dependent methyltransferase [Betaproteobacteria bacterium]
MNTNKRGTLFLIPVNLSEPFAPGVILPEEVIAIALRLDFYIAENAKTARAFLKALGVARPLQEVSIRELNTRTDKSELAELLHPLLAGNDVGLVSEAGAPGVADPGATIVELAHRQHINVMPLVGPSSILLGLMASGLNGQKFAFHGYLPQEKVARIKAIQELEQESRRRNMTQMFIETPYRNHALLGDLIATLTPATRLCVASDLTGPTQTIIQQPVAAWRKAPIDARRTPAMFLLLA